MGTREMIQLSKNITTQFLFIYFYMFLFFTEGIQPNFVHARENIAEKENQQGTQ